MGYFGTFAWSRSLASLWKGSPKHRCWIEREFFHSKSHSTIRGRYASLNPGAHRRLSVQMANGNGTAYQRALPYRYVGRRERWCWSQGSSPSRPPLFGWRWGCSRKHLLVRWTSLSLEDWPSRSWNWNQCLGIWHEFLSLFQDLQAFNGHQYLMLDEDFAWFLQKGWWCWHSWGHSWGLQKGTELQVCLVLDLCSI